MSLLNFLVTKYGKVIAGDYKNCGVSYDGKRIIFLKWKNYCFTKSDVSSYNVTNVTLTGGNVTIEFKDGKKSLIKVNPEGLDIIQKVLF